jgi:hypothetical protein
VHFLVLYLQSQYVLRQAIVMMHRICQRENEGGYIVRRAESEFSQLRWKAVVLVEAENACSNCCTVSLRLALPTKLSSRG